MRWLLTLPEPIDLGRLPCLSLRYRASGHLVPSTYAVWLGGKRSGARGDAAIALSAGELQADGAWHHLASKLSAAFPVTQLAVGLDCDGDEARLTLDCISFSSRPLCVSIRQSLDYEPLGAVWPPGKNGFIAAAVEVRGGRASPFLGQRLGLSDWFETDRIRVGEVPLVVERDLGRIQHSPLATFGDLAVKLPPGVREVYLLTAAAVPVTEPWGIDPARPKRQDVLDVPEKVFFEIRYATGPADRVLPLDAATGQWGLKRGLSLSVVHPDPTRHATELLLADRMQTATFALVGVTLRTAAPRIAEPNWNVLSRGLAAGVSCHTACGLAARKPAHDRSPSPPAPVPRGRREFWNDRRGWRPAGPVRHSAGTPLVSAGRAQHRRRVSVLAGAAVPGHAGRAKAVNSCSA